MKNINLENTYARLPEKFFSRQLPEPVPGPELVVLNEELAHFLGLETEFLRSREGAEILAGNRVTEGSEPISQAYAGHQFGHFTMLGDGRAVLLGECMGRDGKRYDIQLKGSGRTPYSRDGDGKAVLGPMLREYIISEGMYGLRIPTTRSLSVCTTGENVMREQILPGAVLARVAGSHIRVGTFEYAAAFLGKEDVKKLADHTIGRHFPEAAESGSPYLDFLKAVVKNQAETIAKWLLAGFVHGVMNTDNMTISGETIDYGPCAFLDEFDPDAVFSSIDREGRYAFRKQPEIGIWNLTRFAETLLPLLAEKERTALNLAHEAVADYWKEFQQSWVEGMRGKLGLFEKKETDRGLVEQLLTLMKIHHADYTNTFLDLTMEREEQPFFQIADVKAWKNVWEKRLRQENRSREEVRARMEENNPVVIPRNYLVEEALERAWKDHDSRPVEALAKAVRNPYDYQNIPTAYTKTPQKNKCYRTYCGT